MKIDQNAKRWMELPAYQELMRQVHCDIYVGLKNGVRPDECKKALCQLGNIIKKSVKWEGIFVGPKKEFVTKAVACPRCKGTGRVNIPPAYPRFHPAYEDCPDCYGEGKVAISA